MKNAKFILSARLSCISVLAIALLAISAAAQAQTEGAVGMAVRARADLNLETARKKDPVDHGSSITNDYHIGVDDLLRIELKDIPDVPKSVRVRSDGTISFPLAGENVVVAGKTASAVEALIADAVKTVTSGGARVKVTEYLSHTITVWGLVETPGEQQIQRDAVPFYVIKAMMSVGHGSDRVRIMRANSAKPEEFNLGSLPLDSVLVYPGDSIEFANGPGKGN